MILREMMVYVLETGCYENEGIVGIYATPEAAMAAYKPERPKTGRAFRGHEYGKWAGTPWSYEWSGPDEDGYCNFGADWQDAASVRPFEVQT